jgi:hypothetical protein
MQGDWAADGTIEGGGWTTHACWWLTASGGSGRGCTQDVLKIVPQNCTSNCAKPPSKNQVFRGGFCTIWGTIWCTTTCTSNCTSFFVWQNGPYYCGEEYLISSIRLSQAAVHQKNPKTVPMYVRTLGDTSYSENGQNERKQKSLCTKAHRDTQLAYTMVLSNVRS